MIVNIHTRHLDLTDTLREEIETHIAEPLRRHFDRVSAELLVEITHHRALPRRGRAYECRAVLYVPAAPAICVTEEGNDLRAAIDNMHQRLLRLVDRYVEKRLIGSRYPKKYYAAKVYEEQLEAEEAEIEAPSELREAEEVSFTPEAVKET